MGVHGSVNTIDVVGFLTVVASLRYKSVSAMVILFCSRYVMYEKASIIQKSASKMSQKKDPQHRQNS